MTSLETLREFLGWCTAINFVMLFIASIAIGPMRGMIVGIHGKMFGLAEADLHRAYFEYVANYKIAIVVLNMVPYLALVLMT